METILVNNKKEKGIKLYIKFTFPKPKSDSLKNLMKV